MDQELVVSVGAIFVAVFSAIIAAWVVRAVFLVLLRGASVVGGVAMRGVMGMCRSAAGKIKGCRANV